MSRKETTRFGRNKIAAPYRALEAHWYGLLRESGFDDIEVYDNPMNTRLVQHWHSTMHAATRGVDTGGAEFFRLLYEWIDETRYHSRSERFLLAARCAGFDWVELGDRFGCVPPAVRLKLLAQCRAMLRSYSLRKNFR